MIRVRLPAYVDGGFLVVWVLGAVLCGAALGVSLVEVLWPELMG